MTSLKLKRRRVFQVLYLGRRAGAIRLEIPVEDLELLIPWNLPCAAIFTNLLRRWINIPVFLYTSVIFRTVQSSISHTWIKRSSDRIDQRPVDRSKLCDNIFAKGKQFCASSTFWENNKMDLGGVDVWGQIAVETSQMFVSEGGVVKSRFAGTVSGQLYQRCDERRQLEFALLIPGSRRIV